MKAVSISSPHNHAAPSVGWIMAMVLCALVPGWLMLILHFSWGYLIQMLLALVTAIGAEALLLKWRQRPVWFFLKDGSALVTAALLALSLPPLVPWWLTVLAVLIAIVFAKQLFGGLGQNPFNPAMVAYALLLVSLPVFMTTRWASPDFSLSIVETWAIIFHGVMPIDGSTAATPLDVYKLSIDRLTSSEVLSDPIFGHFVASGWDVVNLAFLAGGLFLLWRKIITWHLPVSFLLGLSIMAWLFSWDADLRTPWSLHLLSGATMLGAFFIITDPVSAATSNRGKLIYGFGIGVLVYLIRTWGNYPDAVAFAVLLMNLSVPLIDHYTRPKVYGHKKTVKGFKQ